MERWLKLGLGSLGVLLFWTLAAQAGEIVLTADAHFNEGTLDRVQVVSNNVQLPLQGTALGSWSSASGLPQALRDLALAYANGIVYAAGGWTGTAYSKAVYYAAPGGAWATEDDSLPTAVRDHAMVAGNGYVYVLGGRQAGLPSNAVYAAEINYDRTLYPWTQSPVSLPQPLWGHSAVAYAGFMYVVGGTNQSSDGTALDSVFYTAVNADGTLGGWLRATSLPAPRNHHVAVVSNGILYVAGGYDATGTNRRTVYYARINGDGSIPSWDSTTALPIALHGHMAAIENGLMTVIGGVKQAAPDRSQDSVFVATLNANGTLGSWTATTNYPQRVSHGACYSVPGRVYLVGGFREVSVVYSNVYYTDFATGAPLAQRGTYLSPAFDCGVVATVQSLAWNATLNGQSLAFRHRIAGANKVWNAWSDSSSASSMSINTAARYVQFQAYFAGSGAANPVLHDVTVTVAGVTFLCGSLAPGTWTKANTYVALCDLTLPSGKLTIEPGVLVKFKSGCGLEIGGSELYAVGTAAERIVFTSLSDRTDRWTGIYFNPNSGKAISPEIASTLDFCDIRNAGQGPRNANLYCYATTQPALHNCHITRSTGHGVYLTDGDITLTACTIDSCSEKPLYCDNGSSPSVEDCTISSDNNPAVFCINSSPTVTFTDISGDSVGVYCENSYATIQANAIHHNLKYGVYMVGSAPRLEYNAYAGNGLYNLAVGAGTISYDGTWYNDGGQPYVVLGDVAIVRAWAAPILTIRPGVRVVCDGGVSWRIGTDQNSGGGLRAVGTPDSVITFTSLSGLPNGWQGIFFDNGSNDQGAASVLEHCLVEKAGQVAPWYGMGWRGNILCYATNQPTLADSRITKAGGGGHGIYCYVASPSITGCTVDSNASTGIWCEAGANATIQSSELSVNGMYGLAAVNSSPVVRSSEITGNDSLGIFCDGSAQPTIGDTLGLTCKLYGNGTYDLYNNTANAINARHNFWGQSDSASIAARIYDRDDNATRGRVNFMPFGNLDHDVRAVRIVAPVDSALLGDTVTPQALVANVGKNTESFQVVYRIASFYADTVDVVSLPAGDSAVVDFADWVAGPFGSFAPLCFTDMVGDEFTAYDTVDGFFIIPCDCPVIDSISPDVGGNTGSIMVTIYGARFKDGADVRLSRTDEPDIVSDSVFTLFIDTTTLEVRFGLSGSEPGLWNLELTNQDGGTTIFHEAFSVQPGFDGLSVDIEGRDQIRIGREGTYWLRCWNRGNVDVEDLMVDLTFADGFELRRVEGPMGDTLWDRDSIIANKAEGEILFPEEWATAPDSLLEVSLRDGDIFWVPLLRTGEVLEFELTVFAPTSANSSENYEVLAPAIVAVGAWIGKAVVWEFAKHLTAQTLYVITDPQDDGFWNAAWRTIQVASRKTAESFDPRSWVKWGQRVDQKWLEMIVTPSREDLFLTKFSELLVKKLGYERAVSKGQEFLTAAHNLGLTPERLRVFKSTVRGFSWLSTLKEKVDRSAAEWDALAQQYQKEVAIVRAWDPNDKVGPTGYGGLGHVLPGGAFEYIVFFENVDSATAPAESIWIADTLDPDLDWNTLEFGEIFPGPHPGPNYTSDTNFNPATGVISWGLYGINLPPDTAPYWGEGWVSYAIRPKPDLPTGTRIDNIAAIKFDENPWILAPMDSVPIFNTIDAGPPTSTVNALSDTILNNTFLVCWEADDDSLGSGVSSVDVYVRENGGFYDLWLRATTSGCSTYFGNWGSRYDFYSVARDNVGHGEAVPPFPDASTTIPSCYCPCHGDPACDSIIPDILDVVATVDVAFRGFPPVVSPTCPRENTDVNCDGVTDVGDVVLVVDVAFRNGNYNVLYCHPCAP